MRAELRRLHSPDVADLTSWSPAEGDFGVLIQLMVGPEGGPGEESFDITLCTPGWLAELVQQQGIVDARHHFVVQTYEYDRLHRYLRELVSACDGESWGEVASKVARLGKWEFEDYRE